MKWCLDNSISASLTTPVNYEDLAGVLVSGLESVTSHQSVDAPVMTYDILLAEDNMVNQKVAMKLLENYGHHVQIVENGQLAVDAVKERWHQGKPYDVILVRLGHLTWAGWSNWCVVWCRWTCLCRSWVVWRLPS